MEYTRRNYLAGRLNEERTPYDSCGIRQEESLAGRLIGSCGIRQEESLAGRVIGSCGIRQEESLAGRVNEELTHHHDSYGLCLEESPSGPS